MNDTGPTRVLSPEQHTALTQWFRAAADLLGLKDWDLTVDRCPPSDDAWASITPTGAYLDAWVKVDAHLLTESPERVRWALTHELVHLYHADLLTALRDATAPCDATVAGFIEATVTRYVERMVDQVARALITTGHLPALDAVTSAPALQ